MFTVLCNYTANYEPLINKTWFNNKVPYCQRHGYNFELRLVTMESLHQYQMSKVLFINEVLNRSQEDAWVWWTGADLMITNFTIKLEYIIDTNYHFIIASDFNGINADSFLIRNSEKGRNYFKMIVDTLPNYTYWEGEQGIMKDTYEQYKNDVVKMVPQKVINSYNYADYYGRSCAPPGPLADSLGTVGDWSFGDFVIQWPATSLQHRLYSYDYYSQFIVR